MSVNVYLKEAIRQEEGFEVEQKTGGKPVRNWEQTTFKGTGLSGTEGRLHLCLGYLDDMIPEALLPFVTDVSFHGCFPLQPRRETGIYRDEEQFGDAVVRLEVNSSNYFLRATGTKLGEVRKLHDAIRAGTVRPAESWEQPQQSRPVDELEAELVASRRDLERERNECFRLRDELSEERARITSVRKVAEALGGQEWPICFKKTVMNKLIQTLAVT
ncbi:MAG: hypothetical protein AAB534_01645 [Patescibacteria group bacterium]